MLFKFPKYTQLNYSTILFILILCIKFANLTLTNYDDETYYDAKIDDEKFVNLCKETSKDLESKIAETPATILNNRDRRPYNNDFDDYIAEKIEFLADEMNKIKQKFMDKESLFDGAIEKFNNIFEKAKKESIWNQEKVLEIFDENPHQFFATLDQLLWKIEDKNLEKIEEENGKILIKYTKNIGVINYYKRIVMMVPIEYIILRKTINKFINRLKIEILYIRDIGTIESKIAEIPVTIQNNGDLRPYFPPKKDFDDYIYEKIEFLADEINQLRQNTKHKETLFDHAINKFVKTIEEAKKDADGNEEDEKIPDGIHGLILDKNPHQFFATLNELLWKIDDVNLQKNGEILMKYTEDEGGPKSNHHSKGNLLMVSNKYIILRKKINKFIKELIIQILYVQSLLAIEARMAMAPSMRILEPKYYKYKPMVASKSEFNIFIWNKIKFLADELKRIKKNTNVKESLFDDAINKFVKIIEEAKKDADENHDLILDRIFGKNPHQFFATMDQFLWKIDDKKLEEVEQKNGEILKKYTEKGNVSNHSKKNVFMVPEEYINLRKIINKFINRLKIEIVYGQSFGAILEIEENSKYKQIFKTNFDEMENEAKNFVHKKEGKIRKLKKEIREEGSKKLEEKFIKLAKRKMKDIPHKYNELYFYNLLNNAISDLQKMLVELVAEIVDGKKNGIHGSLVLVELIVKPMLREVFDEATTMPDTTETRNFVEEIVGKDKIRTICLRNIKGSSGIYNRISEKFKGKDNDSNEIPVEFFKFDYDLVEMIKQNLGLPSDFLKIENFILAKTTKKEEKRMAVRKSKIRIAAAKLILVYERLKAMFYEKEELNENEKKNAQEITEHLNQIYMEPIPTKRFGELLYKYLFENFQKV